MQYTSGYDSPIGKMLLVADDMGLTGVWFVGQTYFACTLREAHEEKENHPILKAAKRWLDIYFAGREPDFSVPLHLLGTEFQNEVWRLLCTIPYGATVTYGEIASRLRQKQGMSPQAVGGAVGRNAISVIVPCHRVIGADGSLTGYAGGLERKAALLDLEKGGTPSCPAIKNTIG